MPGQWSNHKEKKSPSFSYYTTEVTMKHRITLLLVTGLFLCMAALQASAQRQMPTPEERTKLLTDSLSLNKDQSAKTLKIYQESDQKRQEIFKSNSEDQGARREAMRDLMGKTDQKIEALLTATQKTKYDAMKVQRMQRWQNRQQPPPEKPKDDTK